MAVLTQTVTTETAINWEELAQKIKDITSGNYQKYYEEMYKNK